MQRRRFGREFKVEAVRLVEERSVSVARAARDLDLHENVLHKWVKTFGAVPVQAFPEHGQMKPGQQESNGCAEILRSSRPNGIS
jgi:transposase